MVEPNKPGLEGVSAGLLNGVMLILFGCAFPAFLAWTTLAGHPDWSHEAASLPAEPRGSWSENLGLLSGSLLLISWGVKAVRKQLALLRAGRS